MRSKVRRCDCRCHQAKKARCQCWCNGAFHGAAGAANRAQIQEDIGLLEQHGFEKGKTAYIEQRELVSRERVIEWRF